ncbi:hypothetical protein [Microterricola pindariensis]|uniref:4-hydroxybenzoate polyprenyltransferase n=1 Tax=Microterricola pindariensis TaxID=478010 RepID=A0ABX5B098_9MICO|nr:hypothetical protein [Microterricola pindariensis]PPL20592.1 hypothetical protein GY24_00220 [Microterricola pindariensis]
MSFLTAVSAQTVHAVDLPIPPIMYGVIALVVFAAFGFVTWSFRDVANRHKAKGDAYAAAHGGAHGTSSH